MSNIGRSVDKLKLIDLGLCEIIKWSYIKSRAKKDGYTVDTVLYENFFKNSIITSISIKIIKNNDGKMLLYKLTDENKTEVFDNILNDLKWEIDELDFYRSVISLIKKIYIKVNNNSYLAKRVDICLNFFNGSNINLLYRYQSSKFILSEELCSILRESGFDTKSIDILNNEKYIKDFVQSKIDQNISDKLLESIYFIFGKVLDNFCIEEIKLSYKTNKL